MNQAELKRLYNLCHDYGVLAYGRFPSWEKVKKAQKNGRVIATSYKQETDIVAGSIRIQGKKHQQSCIMFVMEKE